MYVAAIVILVGLLVPLILTGLPIRLLHGSLFHPIFVLYPGIFLQLPDRRAAHAVRNQ